MSKVGKAYWTSFFSARSLFGSLMAWRLLMDSVSAVLILGASKPQGTYSKNDPASSLLET